MKILKRWLIPVFFTLAVLVLFKSFLLIGYVPTASMEPTLPEGSIIIGLRTFGKLEKGDIIIFEHEGRLLVKRIAACSGDMVEVHGTETAVPERSYYVLGDNAKNSLDSRFWQDPFVPEEHVAAVLIGK